METINIKNKNGLTLVESLVSILLLSTFLCSFFGAFFVSRLSTLRAQHRVVAMNLAREYLEQEIRAGYEGGEDGEQDYYATMVSADPEHITPTVPRTIDGKTYTITPDPYYPNNVENPSGALLIYENCNYKIIGFVVTWTEDVLGSGVGPTCSERATTYIFNQPS